MEKEKGERGDDEREDIQERRLGKKEKEEYEKKMGKGMRERDKKGEGEK